MSDRAAVVVRHEAAAQRFVTVVEGLESECAYRRRGDLLLLTHTAVPPVQEGRGIAAALVATAFQWAREQGLKVRPLCSYVAVYARRHPEVRDLLD